ncbi:MinD-like ATPase involved in chromosome partitioning or flagellar assembly [Nocardiopsis flavescens]|uniref:MinD-like ATPase involved in chromosome partitioning or flagellar assembly n=2 Tax=Nocardiopsis flavescens TaxID=758803 RepID=A0A1M6VAS0_9ACTN|nr:conjugal transfer protein [Nocardiopsis flavescens]SHK78548.1 MinD-like ATPase involved in chromosome partitioning or flagellar assembly [Nocardiopsis flavescens]
MDLPTYTNIWRIEKRLYKLYDFRLPMPLPVGTFGVAVGVFLVWVILLGILNAPFVFGNGWHLVLWVVPPGVITVLITRPVIEGKRLTELLLSHARHLAEARVYTRLAPEYEPAEVRVSVRVWHRDPEAGPLPVPRRRAERGAAEPRRVEEVEAAEVRTPRPAPEQAPPLRRARGTGPVRAPEPAPVEAAAESVAAGPVAAGAVSAAGPVAARTAAPRSEPARPEPVRPEPVRARAAEAAEAAEERAGTTAAPVATVTAVERPAATGGSPDADDERGGERGPDGRQGMGVRMLNYFGFALDRTPAAPADTGRSDFEEGFAEPVYDTEGEAERDTDEWFSRLRASSGHTPVNLSSKSAYTVGDTSALSREEVAGAFGDEDSDENPAARRLRGRTQGIRVTRELEERRTTGVPDDASGAAEAAGPRRRGRPHAAPWELDEAARPEAEQEGEDDAPDYDVSDYAARYAAASGRPAARPTSAPWLPQSEDGEGDPARSAEGSPAEAGADAPAADARPAGPARAEAAAPARPVREAAPARPERSPDAGRSIGAGGVHPAGPTRAGAVPPAPPAREAGRPAQAGDARPVGPTRADAVAPAGAPAPAPAREPEESRPDEEARSPGEAAVRSAREPGETTGDRSGADAAAQDGGDTPAAPADGPLAAAKPSLELDHGTGEQASMPVRPQGQEDRGPEWNEHMTVLDRHLSTADTPAPPRPKFADVVPEHERGAKDPAEWFDDGKKRHPDQPRVGDKGNPVIPAEELRESAAEEAPAAAKPPTQLDHGTGELAGFAEVRPALERRTAADLEEAEAAALARRRPQRRTPAAAPAEGGDPAPVKWSMRASGAPDAADGPGAPAPDRDAGTPDTAAPDAAAPDPAVPDTAAPGARDPQDPDHDPNDGMFHRVAQNARRIGRLFGQPAPGEEPEPPRREPRPDLELDHGTGEQESLGDTPHGSPTAPALTPSSAVRTAAPEPAPAAHAADSGGTRGWRRLAKVVTGGAAPVRSELSPEDVERLRAPLDNARSLVVLGCTGGAGQTVTTLMIGHTLAGYRDERIVAVDVNPGPNGLSRRIGAQAPETLTALLANADAIGDQEAMSAYTGRTPTGLEVVQTLDDPYVQTLDDRDYAQLTDLLGRFYAVTVLDPAATGVARALPAADGLVLVTPANADAERAVSMTFDWLDGNGHAALRANSVLVVNGVSKRSLPDVDAAERVARGRCRAIVRIPWDDHLGSSYTRIDVGALRASTKRAHGALAGVIVDKLLT